MASAGATFPAVLASGLLYDVMHVTTPTGCRTAIAFTNPPAASAVGAVTCGAIGSSVGSRAPAA